MSADETVRLGPNGVQVVAGSNPACPTKPNPFPQNNLAVSPSPTKNRVSAQVSNRASNLRRDEVVSRRFEDASTRDGVLAFRPAHGPEEPYLPHRARGVARRGTADDREVAAARPHAATEGVPLGSPHPLRPRGSASSDRAKESRETPPSRSRSSRRVKRVRSRNRLVGFTYDEAAGVAHFSMYVAGSAGRDRKRATVNAATYDDAVRLWSEFRSRAAEGLRRPKRRPSVSSSPTTSPRSPRTSRRKRRVTTAGQSTGTSCRRSALCVSTRSAPAS